MLKGSFGADTGISLQTPSNTSNFQRRFEDLREIGNKTRVAPSPLLNWISWWKTTDICGDQRWGCY